MKANLLLFQIVSLSLPACVSGQPAKPPLLTVAESSEFKATSLHADVMAFVNGLAERSSIVRIGELGKTVEGRSMPLVILADPPVETAEEAADSGKLVVFAFGNIHAGEVCGKEALMILARDIATTPDHPLLKDLVIVFAPIYNADGNERISKDNRRRQVGPEAGVGQRRNADGLDLNRDYVKLESPEARALVRFYNQWDPAVRIDTHTTNGSHHQYTVTYAAPRSPTGDQNVLKFVRDTMLPEVSKRMEKETGYKSFYYGNFTNDHKVWTAYEGYPAIPRFGTVYSGMRNRVAILSEAYSYASYRDRVLGTRDFVKHCLTYAAENKDAIEKLIKKADKAVVAAGKDPKPDDMVSIRQKPVPFDESVKVLGFIEEGRGRRSVSTGVRKTYDVQWIASSESMLSVARPFGYVFPASHTSIIEKLQQHGIEVEVIREDIELDLEVYRIDEIDRAERAFQNHNMVSVEATPREETRSVPAGSILVRTGQEDGSLVVYLLEPESEDGLCTWNFFDDDLKVGGDFPVARLPKPVSITRREARPLADDRAMNKRIDFEVLYESDERLNLSGSPVSGITWLEDGEHFLQTKDRKLMKVNAVTGRSKPYYDADKLRDALSKLPTIDDEAAKGLTRSPRLSMDEDRQAALFNHENDLYHARLDGTTAVRLTNTPELEAFARFSPDGRFVAFIRDFDLHVVDVETQTDRALTTGGTDLVRNGQFDWVYAEELYSHRAPAFWWSPDSARLAFLQIDDSPVHRFTVVNEIPVRQNSTVSAYPKAGDPNPKVKLGIVSAAGGSVGWVDLGAYDESSLLITRVGWKPNGKTAFFFAQDRAQTWLDFNTVSRKGGEPTRLFRETTEAWVDNSGVPEFLEDGSFLFPSTRSGWRHLYHYDKKGELLDPVTSGEWEVRSVQLVDEEGGWIYFSGTKDSHIQSHFYRVKLDGTDLVRLTPEGGSHRATVDPTGAYFVDSWSDHTTTAKVALRHTSPGEDQFVRMLDINPVYELEEYDLGTLELVQIPMSDGFVLEGNILTPYDFDPSRKYPVWFMTYGGPHAPRIRDAWARRRGRDEMIANMGFVVFQCDPRSASGKGAVSAWTAYEQCGVGELADIVEAIEWFKKKPYVDGDRIGMSGHSYGGFMTSYAMTHSTVFAAGIAGAPVTDWRNYDTIYTERYMNTPQENPEGYDATSVVQGAEDLHGKLLILHGVVDDNVHMQNTLQLIDELQKADKQFELMLYPRSRHGLRGIHYNRIVADFIRKTLGDPQTPTTEPPEPESKMGTK